MDRIVIFTQSNDRLANTLLRGYLRALNERSDMELVAVCLPYTHRNGRLLVRLLRDVASQLLGLFSSRRGRERPKLPLPVFINREARRRGFAVIVPPKGNINDPAFIDRIRAELHPTVAFSCVCLSKFSPELLACFDYAVNYHNALLPDYRGLRATAWSLYCGEETSGYTYHLMNEALDEGFVLKQEALPVHDDTTTMDLDLLKAEMAASAVPEILERVAARDPGQPQVGAGSYYSRKDAHSLQRIKDPAVLPAVELRRRLRAFGSLEIQIDGEWYPVAKLSGPLTAASWLTFTTSDGQVFRPTRINGWPPFLARLLHFHA